MARVLVIHDQAPLRQSLLDCVRRSGHVVSAAGDLGQARMLATAGDTWAIILIGTCAGEPAPVLVDRVKATWPMAEVIVIGHAHDMAGATEAVRHGAYDYVLAADPLGIAKAICSAAAHVGDHAVSLHDEEEEIDEALTLDPAMRSIVARADRAALLNSTVLITGETGTGKEVLARRIHRRSPHRRGRFVPVNCGGLPESLIESELFGYRKGAFTGATSESPGLIKEAEGGVLFLDEIGDMPTALQIHLLRFLDRGEVRAVGSTRVKQLNVRVIAATHRSLSDEIHAKRFREDLFFRLSVVMLQLPPLRARRSAIPALVEIHTRRGARRLGVPVPAVAPEAMAALVRYSWPGNVRELQNSLEQAIVQQSSGVITPADLPPSIGGHDSCVLVPMLGHSHDQLMGVLRRHNGNRTKVAAELGISRTTVWRRLRRAAGLVPSPELA